MTDSDNGQLPRLPLDHEVPVHLMGRRGAISACSSGPGDPPASRSQRRGAISVARDETREVRIGFTTGSLRPDSEFQGVFTQVEQVLLSGLKTGEGQQRRTGKFLTLRPSRRVRRCSHDRLQDRSMMDDDAYNHKQTMKILARVGEWNFNTFVLDTTTGGRSLPTLLLHLFQHYGLMDTFRLDVVKVWKCFGMIEAGYHSTNPYHNAVHATDVTQAMHCFLQERKILEHITPLEVMTSLLAAVTHDLDHPGVNQPFLIATSNHLAALYRNSSVLENHHWRSALCCLSQSGMLNHLDRSQWEDVTFQIRSLILATDITRQHEFLSRLKHYMESRILDLKDDHYRHFILQIALKCADICNPCRPWDISTRWSRRVCEEFFRQGDVERQLKIPVTSLCDRKTTSIAKIQSGFFRFVVTPLFEEWDLFLQTPLSSMLVHNLRGNQEKWDGIVAEENAAVVVPAGADCDTAEQGGARARPRLQRLESALESLLSGRRHSVPLSSPSDRPIPTVVQPLSELAASLGTVVTHFSEDLFLGISASTAPSAIKLRHTLIKQNTFPLSLPAARSTTRATEATPEKASPSSSSSSSHEDSVSKNGGGVCSNNGCGTPLTSSSSDDGADPVAEFARTVATKRAHSDCRGLLGFPVPWLQALATDKKYKPLLRLKSDSDLLQNNGKIPMVSRVVSSLAEEEKENANPQSCSTNVAWRNLYRKGKSQGVGMHVSRTMGRRGSAPVGSLKEEIVDGLQSGSEFLEAGGRRRDSAPVELLQEQLSRLQRTAGRGWTKIRRGSLPSEIPLDAVTKMVPEFLLPNVDARRHPTEFVSTAFRRRSMPADFVKPPPDICRKSSYSGRHPFLEPFPVPSRSHSSNGVDGGLLKCSGGNDWRVGLWPRWIGLNSFDDSGSDPIPTPEERVLAMADAAAGSNGITLFLENKRNAFRCRRRSSVPAEACFFSSSSETDPLSNLTVDIA